MFKGVEATFEKSSLFSFIEPKKYIPGQPFGLLRGYYPFGLWPTPFRLRLGIFSASPKESPTLRTAHPFLVKSICLDLG